MIATPFGVAGSSTEYLLDTHDILISWVEFLEACFGFVGSGLGIPVARRSTATMNASELAPGFFTFSSYYFPRPWVSIVRVTPRNCTVSGIFLCSAGFLFFLSDLFPSGLRASNYFAAATVFLRRPCQTAITESSQRQALCKWMSVTC